MRYAIVKTKEGAIGRLHPCAKISLKTNKKQARARETFICLSLHLHVQSV